MNVLSLFSGAGGMGLGLEGGFALQRAFVNGNAVPAVARVQHCDEHAEEVGESGRCRFDEQLAQLSGKAAACLRFVLYALQSAIS